MHKLALVLTLVLSLVAVAIGADSFSNTHFRDVGGGIKTVTNNSATALMRITIPSAKGGGVLVRYVARAQNATDGHVESGEVFVTAANKGGTITNNVGAKLGAAQAITNAGGGGTLAVTFTTTTTSTTLDVLITVNSNLSAITTEEVGFSYEILANGAPSVTFP